MKITRNGIKFFIAVIIILCIFSAGFTWKFDKVNKELIETQNELNLVRTEFSTSQKEYENNIESLNTELIKSNIIITDLKINEYELIYLGDYKITHYCTEKRKHICGTGEGITATGSRVLAGRTVAVDPSVIPYGTEMYIEGYGWRVAEDCGGAVNGNHIDIAVETHAKALSMGKTTGGVWILAKKGY